MFLITDVVLKDGKHAEMYEKFMTKYIQSATFIDTDTWESITLTDPADLVKMRRKISSSVIWSDKEVELFKALRFVDFCPCKTQPGCVYDWYYDADKLPSWIPYTWVEYYKTEVNAGTLKVYFGECSLNTLSDGTVEVVDLNVPHTVFYPVLHVGGDFDDNGRLVIPVLRTDAIWGVDENGNVGFSLEAFDFEEDVEKYGAPEYLMGYLIYEVLDKKLLERVTGEK